MSNPSVRSGGGLFIPIVLIIIVIVAVSGYFLFLFNTTITPSILVSIKPNETASIITPPITPPDTSANLTVCFADPSVPCREISYTQTSFLQRPQAILDPATKAPYSSFFTRVYVTAKSPLQKTINIFHSLTVLDPSNSKRNITLATKSTSESITLPSGVRVEVSQVNFAVDQVENAAISLSLNVFNIRLKYTGAIVGTGIIFTGTAKIDGAYRDVIFEQKFSTTTTAGELTFNTPTVGQIWISAIKLKTDRSVEVEATVISPQSGTTVYPMDFEIRATTPSQAPPLGSGKLPALCDANTEAYFNFGGNLLNRQASQSKVIGCSSSPGSVVKFPAGTYTFYIHNQFSGIWEGSDNPELLATVNSAFKQETVTLP